MKSVRYGIIGFGGIAEVRLAKEGFGLDTTRFDGNPVAELVAAYDPNPLRQHAAEALGISWRTSVEEMLRDSSIDAIVVATNNKNHAVVAQKALQAGKHVFIEKPAGVTLKEIRNLIKEGKKRSLSIGVDHMMTKNSYNRLTKALLEANTIGCVAHMVLHMEFAFGTTPGEAATWRCSDPSELGGPIGDVGSHCLYMAEYLAGSRVRSLQAVYAPKHLDIAVEDGALINFTLENGIQGIARVAFDQPRGALESNLSNLGYEIYGSEGSIEGRGTLFQLSGHPDEPVALELSATIHGKRTDYRPEKIENIYALQLAEHARSIVTGNLLDGSEALHNLELVVHAHESAANGGSLKMVTPPEEE
ncbi:MAG: Gfo/Idh/MocA family oxidoreductase [Spirochaetales bacterium]|nr:Gfo/Idh/MocA family oxidoreductase [Spirochaetales bacterium]